MKIREITEAVEGATGRKYQHIEDLVFTNGSHGGIHAVERLQHMNKEAGHVEIKMDGNPVIYFGRDSKGVFRMLPKNAWQYLKSGKTQLADGTTTLLGSKKDVENFILNTGNVSGDAAEQRKMYAKQLASFWPYFEAASPKKGFIEAGMLFYPGKMPVLNRSTNTYDFRPNITTFHIPVDSDLGRKIAKAKIMVAATGYYEKLGSDDEGRIDTSSLSTPDMIVQGTTYVQNPPNIDDSGLQKIKAYIMRNAKLIDSFLEPKPGMSNPAAVLYKFYNQEKRGSGADFTAWAAQNLSAKQLGMMRENSDGLNAVLSAVEMITKEKLKLIGVLSKGTHGGIQQTNPEGYVQAHPGAKFSRDLPGQFVKTIDQSNWAPRRD